MLFGTFDIDPAAMLCTINLAGISWGLYFFFYNNAKSRWTSMLQQDELSAPLNLVSGMEAGSLVSAFEMPNLVFQCACHPLWCPCCPQQE